MKTILYMAMMPPWIVVGFVCSRYPWATLPTVLWLAALCVVMKRHERRTQRVKAIYEEAHRTYGLAQEALRRGDWQTFNVLKSRHDELFEATQEHKL